MAMNKSEKARVEWLEDEVRFAKALRFTPHVSKDVGVPLYNEGLAKGWSAWGTGSNPRVQISCSSSVYHAHGYNDKTISQRPIEQYSTKLLALRGLRNELEEEFARTLAKVDRQIEEELAK